MVDAVEHPTHGVAVELLNSYRAAVGDRDRIILLARAAGLTKNEIHIHSGIARSTIDRIIDRGTDA